MENTNQNQNKISIEVGLSIAQIIFAVIPVVISVFFMVVSRIPSLEKRLKSCWNIEDEDD